MFEWLPDQIAAAVASSAARGAGWRFALEAGASESAISRCEVALGMPLPPSYREFLLQYDGASLFITDVRLPDGRVFPGTSFEIAGTVRLPALNSQMRTEQPEDCGRLIFCADTPQGSADHCALNPDIVAHGEHALVDAWHEQSPECWQRVVVAPSFETWLTRVFDAALRDGNPYYWVGSAEVMAAYRACIEESRARRKIERSLESQSRPGSPGFRASPSRPLTGSPGDTSQGVRISTTVGHEPPERLDDGSPGSVPRFRGGVRARATGRREDSDAPPAKPEGG